MLQTKAFVATVHWYSDDWVDSQERTLREQLPLDQTLPTLLDGVGLQRAIAGDIFAGMTASSIPLGWPPHRE